MFNDSGNQIKGISKFLCYAGIVVSLILLIACIAVDLAILGIIIAVVGSFLSWIGSIFCYGFGELIENSRKTCALLEKHLKDEQKPLENLNAQSTTFTRTSQSISDSGVDLESVPTAAATFPRRTDQMIFCPECGQRQPGNRNKCWSCGIAFEYDDE